MQISDLQKKGNNGDSESVFCYLKSITFRFQFPLTALLQHGGDSAIRNTDGKTAQDLAEATAKLVLSGRFFL